MTDCEYGCGNTCQGTCHETNAQCTEEAACACVSYGTGCSSSSSGVSIWAVPIGELIKNIIYCIHYSITGRSNYNVCY